MNKLSKQQYVNKNMNAKNFVTSEQLILLQFTIIPKILETFEGKYKKLWENKINIVLPKQHLNFKSEDNYLDSNKITKIDVIRNSILYSLPSLEDEDVNYLIGCFSIFSKFNKIKVLIKENQTIPIYNEIINCLEYMNHLRSILNNYPKNFGNHYGTKLRSSSYKTIVEKQIKILEDRLENSFFTLESEDEIKKTEIQIKFMKYSLMEKYKNLPEMMNYINIFIGFDNKHLYMSELEIKTFKQLCSFFNGIRTSKEEILNSVAIYLRIQSNIKNENEDYHKDLATSIIDILRFFFPKTIKKVEKNKKKKTYTYSKTSIKNKYHIKTFLDGISIYTYRYKNSNDFIYELFTIGINYILGFKTIVDEDKNIEIEPTHFQVLKNIMKFRKEFNLTKDEYKTFLSFIEKSFNY